MTDGKRPRRRRRGGQGRGRDGRQQRPADEQQRQQPDGERPSQAEGRQRGRPPGPPGPPAGDGDRRRPRVDTRGQQREARPEAGRRGGGDGRGGGRDGRGGGRDGRERRGDRDGRGQRTYEAPVPQDERSVELGAQFREAQTAMREARKTLDKRKAEHGDEPEWLVEQYDAAVKGFEEAATEWSEHLSKTGRKVVRR
jgi:hypothetical protein